jgi:hypothetical protein
MGLLTDEQMRELLAVALRHSTKLGMSTSVARSRAAIMVRFLRDQQVTFNVSHNPDDTASPNEKKPLEEAPERRYRDALFW